MMCNHACVTQAYLLSSRGQARCISQNNIFDIFFVSSLLEEWVLQEFRGCWPKGGGRKRGREQRMKGGGRNGGDGREGGKKGRGKEGWWEEEMIDVVNQW